VKIAALEVHGYGVWSELKLADLSEGLNVFFGPNEAGKTTLLEWVRAMFYGFSPKRARYMAPRRRGRAGGRLWVIGADGPVEIRRHVAADGRGEERLELFGPDGRGAGEVTLSSLLAGVDEATFNNVFAIGLRELQELGTLSDTEAATLLYELSMGQDGVSLGEVAKRLHAWRSQLVGADGGGELAELVARRDRLRREVAELDRLTADYAELVAEQAQVDREVEHLKESVNGLRHEAAVAELALAVQDRWHQRRALDEQLADVGSVDGDPERALADLEALDHRLRQRDAAASQLKQRWRALREEACGLPVNEALWNWAPRIEVLAGQEAWVDQLRKRIAELEGEIARLEERLSHAKRRSGLEDGLQAEAVRSLRSATLKALKQPAAALRRAEREWSQLCQRREAAEQRARQLATEIQKTLEKCGQSELAAAMEQYGAEVARLRRRLQMDERLEQMRRYGRELEEKSRSLAHGRVLPTWALVALGGSFAAGMVGLFLGLLAPSLVGLSSGWGLGTLGIVLMVAAVTAKFVLERLAAQRLDNCQQQLWLLRGQIQSAEREREQFDRQAGLQPDQIRGQLDTAQQQLEALEALLPLDAQRRAAEQEAEAAGQQLGELESRRQAARDRWHDVLAAVGLPGQLSPKQVRRLTAASDRIVQLSRRLELAYEELQQRTGQLEALNGQLAEIVAHTGAGGAEQDPVQQINSLRQELAEQKELRTRRDELRDEAKRVRRQALREQRAVTRLRARRRRILRRAGANDVEGLRQLAERASRVRELRLRRETIQREIDAALARRTTEDEIAEMLDGHPGTELTGYRQQVLDRLGSAEAQLRQRFERRGQLAEQLGQLSGDRRPAAKRFELATVEARLAQAIDRWKTLAATAHLLDAIRSDYEQKRQPETLCEASGYLEQITQGRYRRVWTPLGENVLFVDTADGEPLCVEGLSQGTREQLFLALRLAVANTFARGGARLPVILDDVLVNFDNPRARAAAELLTRFADGGHQVLVFTCHEHIAAIFEGLDVPVVPLPSYEQTARAPSARRASATPKTRRRPKRKARRQAAPQTPAGAADSTSPADDDGPPEKPETAAPAPDVQSASNSAAEKARRRAPEFQRWVEPARAAEPPKRSRPEPSGDGNTPPAADQKDQIDGDYQLAPLEDDEPSQAEPVHHGPTEAEPQWDPGVEDEQWLEQFDEPGSAEAA